MVSRFGSVLLSGPTRAVATHLDLGRVLRFGRSRGGRLIVDPRSSS